jgi:signal transduction histidine kinase/signal recognition particle receptor subunit beta
MVQFDNQHRQIKIKIVYYGPAVGGKTTCLQHIHRVTDPQRRTKLYSLNTASDRTLFFDLLSLNLGRIRGYRLALQLYTVPGQVQYDATRRTVLAGADGIVFVADSQVSQRQANLESLENLWTNMAANGLDREKVPVVLQYNKRDLDPIQKVEEMEAALNPDKQPALPTVAITGEGVLESFAAIGERTLAAVADKLGVGTSPQAISRLQEQMRKAIQPFLGAEGEATPAADDVEVTVTGDGVKADEVLSEEVLVGEAVRANMAMTDVTTRLDIVSRQLERKVRVMDSISQFGHAVSNQRDPARVLRLLITEAIRLLQLQGASVIIVPGSGRLREAVVHGFKQDPLLHAADSTGAPVASALLNDRQPRLLVRELDDDSDGSALAAVEGAGFSSAVAVPMMTQEKVVGLLAGYGDKERTDLDDDDLQLATVLASTAAMGYANAISWRQMEDFSRGLEAKIEERAGELKKSLAETRRLATDLEEKKNLLETAYQDLEALDEVKNKLINRLSLDLRTPITSLFTAAKIIRSEKDVPPEKAERLLTIVHDESEKLMEIVQSVFQASVIATSARDVEREAVPAQELFRNAIAPLRDLAADRDVRIQVLIPSGLETISCEPKSTEAALRAVIKNGVEFSNSGEVKLEVRRMTRDNDPWLQLRVSDSGTGISEQDLPHVFEAFWQGDDTAAGKRHGIGLGLTIAQRVMENHGGSIVINSGADGGTEVVMSIPQGVSKPTIDEADA